MKSSPETRPPGFLPGPRWGWFVGAVAVAVLAFAGGGALRWLYQWPYRQVEAQLELGLTSEQVRSRLGEPDTVHARETAPEDYYQPGWARREREITGSVEIYILGEPICYVWYDPAGRVQDWFLGGS